MKKVMKIKSVQRIEKPEKRIVRIVKLPNKGDSGYTPVKDKDYFDWKSPTEEELLALIEPRIPKVENWYTPKKGVDYFDGVPWEPWKPWKDFPKEKVREMIEESMAEKMPELMRELEGKWDVTIEELNKGFNIVSKGKKYFVGGDVVWPKLRLLVQMGDLDLPVGLVGQAGKTIKVKTDESGFELWTGGGGWAVNSVNWQTGVVVLDTGDIAEATDLNYVSDAQLTVIGNTSWTNTGDVTVSDSSEIDLTLTGQQISASIVSGSIDESKLDASVNASLDLADTAVQPAGLSGYELLSNKATDFTTVNNTLYPTVQAVNTAINTAVTGLLDYRGSYDASTNLFPATGGSGLVGAILSGDFWICSVAGTLGGTPVTLGDLIIAIVDTPWQTAGNWDLIENTLGYTPENVANKENTTIDTNTTKYPTVNLLKTGLDTKQPLDTQLTSVAGLSYASNALKVIRVNAWETDFELATISAGSGDVVWPASATDNAIARFDSTTGKLIQNSAITINDDGTINLVTGTTTISPLKFTSWVNLTTPVAWVMEFDWNELYISF